MLSIKPSLTLIANDTNPLSAFVERFTGVTEQASHPYEITVHRLLCELIHCRHCDGCDAVF